MTVDIEDLITAKDGAEYGRMDTTSVVRVGMKKKKQDLSPSSSCRRDDDGNAGVPGTASVWVKTFGCSHNSSDSEYMAGQLEQYGYRIAEDSREADLWLVNTCTVKNPSEVAMVNIVNKGRRVGKPMVVAGCVPQGDKKIKALEGISLLGVSQIDRVVEAVEETLQGNTVQLLSKKSLPRLDLPKVRKNKHIEIIPLSTGCLGSCTYCKTKHARGELGSYDPEAIVGRARTAAEDPDVREIWLSSEDTGAYGRDLGIKLPYLLRRIVAVLPKDGRTRLRVGMSNPPFMLDTLDEIAEVLNHPLVFSYLHIPVQSGSNSVLGGMNREYTVEEFRKCADTLLSLVPDLELATDIICGFPGETEEDHQETMRLVEDYAFPHCHISQFYPRPGTPAARMKRVPTQIVKARTRQVSALVDSFTDVYKSLEGTVQYVSIVEKAADRVRLVGHTETYAQILIDGPESLIGQMALVKITKATRWSAFGMLLDEPLGRDITGGVQLSEGQSSAPPSESKEQARGASSVVGDAAPGRNSTWSSSLYAFGQDTLLALTTTLQNFDSVDACLYLGLGLGVAGIAWSSFANKKA
ncbi:radical SAM methylthiotransferase [Chloropicon primus]|uniref:Threonylcarbamoyladenosine tRNA methylthiotransferase n=1 Tax=Chloropicon primus TaxID=1764295 RepID=A0A5B8N0H8_9CHLO|nr:radical SAM methylthiotransferase [Chloropicon primus]UPR04719.1 radical SAM methylthiotransferase [Chloropicon primus]|mmetsp:Transcript_14506/g.41328  ORF Transcript_14506/g.41328 Transcript_14506/m.41328 type:complete len:581 (-) Transcript_14506:3254-4996(-)|eukprot:QDZ25522.1 radical SAM methylthiotransferase [Chloropicon primus]